MASRLFLPLCPFAVIAPLLVILKYAVLDDEKAGQGDRWQVIASFDLEPVNGQVLIPVSRVSHPLRDATDALRLASNNDRYFLQGMA